MLRGGLHRDGGKALTPSPPTLPRISPSSSRSVSSRQTPAGSRGSSWTLDSLRVAFLHCLGRRKKGLREPPQTPPGPKAMAWTMLFLKAQGPDQEKAGGPHITILWSLCPQVTDQDKEMQASLLGLSERLWVKGKPPKSIFS